MRKVLSFASLTLATQIVLLLQQLALLPLQIRHWDSTVTAAWYGAIALSALTNVADLGLRSAGHAELVAFIKDPEDATAQAKFRQIWHWIRIMVGVVTTGVALFSIAVDGGQQDLWRIALIVSGGLETILTVRIMYLDSLGWYNRAESGYLIFAAARLAASLLALTLFNAQPAELSLIYLISAAAAVAIQSLVCRRIEPLRLSDRLFRIPSADVVASARFTFAAPLAQWAQIHFPVIVLSSIAPPIVVTAYVSLRAIFGVVRQSVQQIARAASVEYIRLTTAGSRPRTEAVFSLLMVVLSSLGACLSCLIMVISQHISRFESIGAGTSFFQVAALAFGLSSSFLSYQILLAVMMRLGNLGMIARRLYLYIGMSFACAVIALLTKMPELYVVLAAAAEIAMAVLFLSYRPSGSSHPGPSAGRRAMAAAGISSASVLLIGVAEVAGRHLSLRVPMTFDTVGSAASVAVYILVIALLQAFMNRDLRRFMPLKWRRRRA